MDNSKTYCVMPHIGMSIQNHGDICACNLNNLSFKKDNEETFYIHTDGLKDSWSSKTRQYISELLDSGQGHHPIEHNLGCSNCYGREEANLPSQRTELNALFKNVKPLPSQPRVLIIKPGNVCNLACRMCNPATSSNWYSDGYKLAVKYENVTESFPQWTKKFEHIKNGFSSDNESFWSDFDKWLPNLVFVDIYGGEPFLSNRLFESLKKVADTGESSNVSLQMHTNATIYNKSYLDILSKFKNVSLNLSVDSHAAEHNSYIRYPVNGALLLENIFKFKNYIDTHENNITLGITTTFNTINIYDFGEIITKLNEFGVTAGLNFVNDPIEYDFRILPTKVKEKIIEKNKTSDLESFNSFKEYIMQEIPNSDYHFKKFWQTTKDLDQFRNQSFEITFPEYYDILKTYI